MEMAAKFLGEMRLTLPLHLPFRIFMSEFQ